MIYGVRKTDVADDRPIRWLVVILAKNGGFEWQGEAWNASPEWKGRSVAPPFDTLAEAHAFINYLNGGTGQPFPSRAAVTKAAFDKVEKAHG